MTTPHDPNRPGGGSQQGDYPGYGAGQPGQQPPAYGSGGQPPYGGQPGGYGSYPAQGGGYGPPPAELPKGLAIGALILGILGFLGSWVVVGGVLGIVAIILGIIAARKAGRGEAGGRGMAITGVVLGALSIVVAVLVAIGLAFIFNKGQELLQECRQYQDDPERFNQCVMENAPLQNQSLDAGATSVVIRN